MATNMYGMPYATYSVAGGKLYKSDAAGLILNVAEVDVAALARQGLATEQFTAAAAAAAVGAVLTVAGRSGNVVLSHTDISGLGSAAVAATTAFDAAGVAAGLVAGLGSAAMSATTDFDAAGTAATLDAALPQGGSGTVQMTDGSGAFLASQITDNITSVEIANGVIATPAATPIKLVSDTGVVLGASTVQGQDTLNAVGLYVNGVPVSLGTPDADGRVTTTDATSQVVVATYTPAHSTLIQIDGIFVGRKQGGGDAAARKATASFLTDSSGVITQVGTTIKGGANNTGGATAWVIDIVTDASAVHLVVTGQSSTSIDWHVTGSVTLAP